MAPATMPCCSACCAMHRRCGATCWDTSGISRWKTRSAHHQLHALDDHRRDESGEEADVAQPQVAVLVVRQVTAERIDVDRHRAVHRAVGFQAFGDLAQVALLVELAEM